MHLCAQSVRKRFHDNDASDGGEDPSDPVLQIHIYQRKYRKEHFDFFFFVSHKMFRLLFLPLTKTNKTVMRYIYHQESKKIK
jgi:hypothetical protein